MAMSKALLLLALLLASSAKAEEACPKYRSSCVPLDHFKCSNVAERDPVNRLCYDAAVHCAIVWLGNKNVPYHYCAIGSEAIQDWMAAPSIGRYYIEHIRSKPNGQHGPFDCRDHPVPTAFN